MVDQVTKRTPWRTLASLLDPLGIIRVGEILRHTQLPYHAKHPVLPPKMQSFTNMIYKCRYTELH